MGRLPSLAVALRRSAAAASIAVALALSACDAPSSGGAPTSRSEQVMASGGAPTTAPAPTAQAHAPASAAPRARKLLCDGDGNARGRTLPKMTLAHVEASGALPLEGAMPPARGRWTWINFWAAWCGPCKEEMPRLAAWQSQLTKQGALVRFAFVSLDDDSRQLHDFLEKQPQDGVRSSLWLPEGPNRTGLLAGLKMKSSPELPEQALIDPTGRVRCFVEGAVDDSDFAEIAEIVTH